MSTSRRKAMRSAVALSTRARSHVRAVLSGRPAPALRRRRRCSTPPPRRSQRARGRGRRRPQPTPGSRRTPRWSARLLPGRRGRSRGPTRVQRRRRPFATGGSGRAAVAPACRRPGSPAGLHARTGRARSTRPRAPVTDLGAAETAASATSAAKADKAPLRAACSSIERARSRRVHVGPAATSGARRRGGAGRLTSRIRWRRRRGRPVRFPVPRHLLPGSSWPRPTTHRQTGPDPEAVVILAKSKIETDSSASRPSDRSGRANPTCARMRPGQLWSVDDRCRATSAAGRWRRAPVPIATQWACRRGVREAGVQAT